MSGRPRVAIIGGGGGGLALAAFLAAADIEADVYEQASQLGEVGAGVQLGPNGLRLLDRIGLGDQVRGLGTELLPGSTYRRMDGAPTTPIQTTDSAGAYSAYGMHRADLISLLAGGVPADRIHTGKRVTAVEQSTGEATACFADGSRISADVVVGADGIHSVVRAQFAGSSEPVFSGTIAYRGLIDADRLDDWPPQLSELWMGQGKHFLVFPVRGGRMLNYVGFIPSDDRVRESWSAPGDPDELRAAFAGWDPRIEHVLARVESCFWWGLYDREPIDTWTHARVTLLGDAAHPMLPHLGQGVNQAIEDAATLAAMLRHHGAEVTTALEGYESLRLPRTRVMQTGSRQFGARFDRSGDARELDARDAEIQSARDFRLWIFDHDAASAADDAIRETHALS
ncbi:2-polyprenyl-6-methoxyphenol hydroxylase [Microbacterium protaetiae]|uniref:2-polyprenyl-6-methoxyphenol hydroxylase n=1 Tax=Microbacterium protaetiae TaxID=2509458 RepID=A0A4V0YD18_9MICO|nr:FAD-dependent monooxygenase [Microbacterium protaetiae]QAY59161.1 2-polyprenyl-6-methoxyphenol hydroxylase [Microbacterium protaetiae]